MITKHVSKILYTIYLGLLFSVLYIVYLTQYIDIISSNNHYVCKSSHAFVQGCHKAANPLGAREKKAQRDLRIAAEYQVRV